MEPMMIRRSNFLDEAKHRALDLRKLVEKTEGSARGWKRYISSIKRASSPKNT
jgi:hypothetical protein